MRLLKDILHLDFIIQDEYELDEIIRNYGKVGNEIDDYVGGIVKDEIQIKRFFKRIEFYWIGENEYDLTEDTITKEQYFKAIDDNDGDFIYSTGLNYTDFLNDFDFENFSSFYEHTILTDLFFETIYSVEDAILNVIKDSNAKMILNSLIQYIASSTWFLKKFKDDGFSRRTNKANNIQKKLCGYFIL
jgi:hypothetical protein